MSEEVETCARCGKPAKGFATINSKRHCHEDVNLDCYQLAQEDRLWGN